MYKLITKLLIPTSVIFLLSSCGTTPPSQHYLLSPADVSAATTSSRSIILGIGPVSLPKYLKRPEIVSRSNPNQLGMAVFHRWGEPLQDNFSRVLAQNLARMVPAEQTVNYPWKRTAGVNYQVRVDVNQFEPVSPTEVVLDVRWEVTRKPEGGRLARGQQRYSEKSANDQVSQVAALSRTLERLSRDIATAISQEH